MKLFSLFKKSNNPKFETSNSMKKYLIVGLGNIGEKYEETRHNIGFKILDYLSKEEGVSF